MEKSAKIEEGSVRHRPVLLAEVMQHLSVRPGGVYVDGTFGAGGYSRAILEAGGTVLAIDRDPSAIAAGAALKAEFPDRLTLVEARFSELDALAEEAGLAPADGIVLDVGVSSMQLDEAGRGFSFRLDGPLDMRMSGDGPSAADVVNRAPSKELTRIIGSLGEERKAGRIARAIVSAREEAAIDTTGQLARIVETALGGRAPGHAIHPATRTFQALRIFVNRELEELAEALAAAERLLREGGRLVVVVFHSLEDRIVKRFLRERSEEQRGSRHQPMVEGPAPTFRLLTRGIKAGEAELESNPRARSARLRAGERTAASPRAIDRRLLGVPALAGISGPEAYQ
ncbi:16S rRNA (cytosine(1402)-N(4))-methyltransferase RsmH [Afifella sp. IM 167]|uniref:16S rRNA (cytosine(1402)-N(4))-methyltransferase RsmH n=1 Tax=Afifella sp. IM 167 TaxID=2033586 RepID=UPI001CCE3989|nr:16S rRNA (cytosine(1402)-N(4))-methyltransferase RsmH [Afifella sp. IM 167]MBZ8131650.1 16S rRNA (cytosine(1402)-N(4))-methyltransferase [Afifella sp. IM 167]